MSDSANALVEHFFRHESANLVSVLTRVFGFDQLHLVEDMVQSTMLQALNQWKINGVPENPAAWVHHVAKNKILDALRRNEIEARAFEAVAADASGQAFASSLQSLFDQENIEDSLLRMMFAICGPVIDRHTQIALTLKILCGFSVSEIASALLINEEAARKRIYRGKKQLSESNVRAQIPAPNLLGERIGGVHEVLYLMFNEGYHASSGKKVVREDVCEEACRLCHLLCGNREIATSATKALLALMLYHAARLNARVADDGSTVMLDSQDRTLWDQRLIRHADYWLGQSAGSEITTYHLEAGICQLHCRANDFAETDWSTIVRLYDRLIEMQPTPMYRLNRAIALGENGQIEVGISELEDISRNPQMAKYHLLDCSLAHLYELSGDRSKATSCLLTALTSCKSTHEKALIKAKLNRIRRC